MISLLQDRLPHLHQSKLKSYVKVILAKWYRLKLYNKAVQVNQGFYKMEKNVRDQFLLSCPLRTWVNMDLKSFSYFVDLSNFSPACPTNPYSAIHLTSFLGRLFVPFLFSFRLHYILWVLNSLSTFFSLRPSNFNCLFLIPSTNERKWVHNYFGS